MPSKPSGSTDFDNDRARTDQFKRELEAMRKEVQAELRRLVAEEVDRVAAQNQEQLNAAIEHAMRAAKPRGAPASRRSAPTITPRMLLAGGVSAIVVVALVLYIFFPNVLRRSPPPAQVVAGEASVAPQAAPVPSPTLEYRSVSTAYGQQFDSRDKPVRDLVDVVKRATQAATLTAAIAHWQEQASSAQENEHVHAALVQYVIGAHFATPLVVDGAIARAPCRGQSCQAVLQVWTKLAGQEPTIVPAPPAAPTAAEFHSFEQYLVGSFTVPGRR